MKNKSYNYLTKCAKYFYNKNMKKTNITKFLMAIFICIIGLLTFTGCDVEGSSTMQGLYFVKDVYYVDLNVDTFLDYKVYPSTASDYIVSVEIDKTDPVLSQYYNISNGIIRIYNKDFGDKSIQVNLKSNEFEDSCLVKLREYPTSISFNSATQNIVAGGLKTLEIEGVFKKQSRLCYEDEFNYKITSSNPSVVQVIDSDRLLVASTGRMGESDITVEILNGKGEDLSLKAKTTIRCENNISYSFATVGNDVVKNKDEIVVSNGAGSRMPVAVKYFDNKNFLLENDKFTVQLSNNSVLHLTTENGKTYLTVLGEGKVKVTLVSTGVNANGLPDKITFTVNVQFS